MPKRKPESYDSMASAASVEGLSIELLKRAKKAGCPAFRGSRVYRDGLRKWITANATALEALGTDSLKDQKTALEIRKLKRIEDKEDRLLVKKEEIAATIRRVLSKSSASLESALVNEYPSRCVGLDVAQVREMGKQLYDRLMVDFQNLGKEFGE